MKRLFDEVHANRDKAGNPSLALEEFEIEKLIAKDQKGEKSEFDDLLLETEARIEKANESPNDSQTDAAAGADQSVASSLDESGERISGDSEISDSETPDTMVDNPELEAVLDEKPTEGITTESLRLIVSDFVGDTSHYYSPAFESFGSMPNTHGDSESFFSRSPEGSNWKQAAGHHLWSATKWLASLGIEFSTNQLPKILSTLYKGTVYSFNRLGYLFAIGLASVEQYIVRRVKSFNNLSSEIGKAKKVVNMLPSGLATSDQLFDNKQAISQLIVGDSVDVRANIVKLKSFLDSVMYGLNEAIKNDMGAIAQIVSYSHVSNSEAALKLLRINFGIKGMTIGSVVGFEAKSKLLTTYHSSTVLPGNAVLVAHVPRDDIETRDEWIEAYRESDMFIGINKASVKVHDTLPLLNKTELAKLVDEIDSLCQLCIQQQAFYDDLKKQKIRLRSVYKSYFESLVHRSKRASVKDTLVDLVTIKNSYIDKVYIPAAIDMHDYSVRVISSALRFVHKNASALSK